LHTAVETATKEFTDYTRHSRIEDFASVRNLKVWKGIERRRGSVTNCLYMSHSVKNYFIHKTGTT